MEGLGVGVGAAWMWAGGNAWQRKELGAGSTGSTLGEDHSVDNVNVNVHGL